MGLLCIVAGGLIIVFSRLPFFFRLPGDFYIRRKNFVLYFPLATSIVLSIIASLVFFVLSRIGRR
jgi:hypothetical protein